jgi:hypothetical protein
MTRKLSRRALVLVSSIVVSCASIAGSAQTKTNPDAQLLADFQSRIDKYMEIHKRAEKESPPLKETKDAFRIEAAQETMAKKIREARKSAVQGEIFTPEIRQLFRRLMYPEIKGPEGADAKAAMKDDAPKGGVPLKVNAKYPDSQPLPTVPPNILAALPKLPEHLEYRIVGKDLILRDLHANLIVDFIPKAIN